MNLKSEKIAIIFGGSGFIGRHLIGHLQELGFSVHVADVENPNLPQVHFHHCDVRNIIQIGMPASPSVIFNLAAVHRTPGHDSDEYYETNVIGALNIATWAELVACRTIFFASSISVYGPEDEIKDENSKTRPTSSYGRSKLIAERIFRSWLDKEPTIRKLIICRPAAIFGLGENGNFTRMARAISNGSFVIPGNTNIIKSSGYVKDLVKSVTFVTNQEGNFILYNFVFPEEYSISQLINSMVREGGFRNPLNIRIGFLHPLMVRIGPLKSLGQRIEKLTLPTRIRPRYLELKGFQWEYNLEEAMHDWFSISKFDQVKF